MSRERHPYQYQYQYDPSTSRSPSPSSSPLNRQSHPPQDTPLDSATSYYQPTNYGHQYFGAPQLSTSGASTSTNPPQALRSWDGQNVLAPYTPSTPSQVPLSTSRYSTDRLPHIQPLLSNIDPLLVAESRPSGPTAYHRSSTYYEDRPGPSVPAQTSTTTTTRYTTIVDHSYTTYDRSSARQYASPVSRVGELRRPTNLSSSHLEGPDSEPRQLLPVLPPRYDAARDAYVHRPNVPTHLYPPSYQYSTSRDRERSSASTSSPLPELPPMSANPIFFPSTGPVQLTSSPISSNEPSSSTSMFASRPRPTGQVTSPSSDSTHGASISRFAEENMIDDHDELGTSTGGFSAISGQSFNVLGKRKKKSGESRGKINVACAFCRRRKLRCSGKPPCLNCASRDIGDKCIFDSEAKRRGPGKKPKAKAGKGGRLVPRSPGSTLSQSTLGHEEEEKPDRGDLGDVAGSFEPTASPTSRGRGFLRRSERGATRGRSTTSLHAPPTRHRAQRMGEDESSEDSESGDSSYDPDWDEASTSGPHPFVETEE